MDLKARVDVNCERKDGLTENRTPMSHTAKAGATKKTIAADIIVFGIISGDFHSDSDNGMLCVRC